MSCNYELPVWVDYFSAIAPTVAAFIAIGVGTFTYCSMERQRKASLFELRYNFYRRLEKYWLSKQFEDTAPIDELDLIPIAEEALWLFGRDIHDHVMSLEKRPVQGSPFFADEWFSAPFGKYLELK